MVVKAGRLEMGVSNGCLDVVLVGLRGCQAEVLGPPRGLEKNS